MTEQYKQLYLSSSGYKSYNSVNTQNGKHTNNAIAWNALYDGDKANVKLNVINGDKKQNMSMKLNNTELRKLYKDILGHPTVNTPLEQRLLMDFAPSPASRKTI